MGQTPINYEVLFDIHLQRLHGIGDICWPYKTWQYFRPCCFLLMMSLLRVVDAPVQRLQQYAWKIQTNNFFKLTSSDVQNWPIVNVLGVLMSCAFLYKFFIVMWLTAGWCELLLWFCITAEEANANTDLICYSKHWCVSQEKKFQFKSKLFS